MLRSAGAIRRISTMPEPLREPTLDEQTDAHEASLKKAAAAAQAEPTISEDLRSVVEANGGRLERFDSRLKTVGSLIRKILKIIVEDDTTADEAASEIGDAIRYTVVLDEHAYWANGTRIIEALQQAGYAVADASPGWKRFGYKGRNVKFVTPNGQQFEVQVHTQASLDAAEECHPLYEEWRLTSTSPERKAELTALQERIFAAVPVPDDVELVD
jgi:hypothetical protein